jgi:hypothetical protein
MYTGAGMRKLKMFGLALAAAALVFTITAGQWKPEVSKAAGIVSDWLVRETASIRASDTAHFVTNWAVKGGDSIRDSYAAQLVAGWAARGRDALHDAIHNVVASAHPRPPARSWADASTSHQGLHPLAQESRPAKLILAAQPEPAAEARVNEASAALIATPVLEGAQLEEAPTAAALRATTRRDLGSGEAAADMAQARHKLMLQAKAYRLLSALTDDELEKVRQKDVLRLASRGQDYIPQNNPVLARIAEHAGITVRGWFARLSASDFVSLIEVLRGEMKPSSTGSVPARIPEQPATSEPKQPAHGAAQTSPERLSLHVRLPGIVYPGDPGAVPTDPRLLARGQRMRLRAADNRH